MNTTTTLTASDGNETIRCEGCGANIVQGTSSIVLYDLCEACDADAAAGASEDCDPS